jgi:YbbR domain-containing protein
MRIGVRLARNWPLKLVSLVFAVALWIFVAVEDKSEGVYTVPLDFTNIPSGLEISALGTPAVDVRVQGLTHVLNRIDEHELRAQLSLLGARVGDIIVRIRPEDVTVTRGIQVVRVTPSQVRVTLAPRARP